jgi:DNA polymerase IV
MPRVIFHLDMDAFYASVEQRDQPALRGRPVIVGGSPQSRGVVCAASYEARKFGVRSAMPSSTAIRLCPQGVFIRPRMDAYREESHAIMQLIAGFGAIIEQVSVDEAYLDVSELCAGETTDEALAAALPLARRMKQVVREQRQLTASIGVAANKLLAKLASDFQKPDGLTLITEHDKVQFLRPLPVRAIHGVGEVTEKILYQAGLRTVGDLQDHPGDLRALVGSFGPQLKQFARGEDDRPLDLSDEVKSISAEETFERDTEDRKILRACLKEQACDIAGRLAKREDHPGEAALRRLPHAQPPDDLRGTDRQRSHDLPAGLLAARPRATRQPAVTPARSGRQRTGARRRPAAVAGAFVALVEFLPLNPLFPGGRTRCPPRCRGSSRRSRPR